MDIFGAARTIYRAIKDDAQAVSKIRAEFASLAVSLATDPSSSQSITSATVNGQTFTASGTMTQSQRLRMLELIVAQLDKEATLSRVSKPYF